MFGRVRLPLLALVICASFLTSACGDPPTREMDQAQGAIDAARAAGADRYATDEYQAAVSALKSAEAAVTERDYRLALNHALDGRERAQNAAKQAAVQQVTQRSAAERRLSEVTALLAEANQRLAAAEGGRAARRPLTVLRAAIAQADLSLQKAGTEITEGDYKASQQRLDEIGVQLKAVVAELEGLTGGRSARPRR